MSRILICTAAFVLSGCASMGEWRSMAIDGTSEAAFAQSVTALNDELPYRHQQLLSLALIDIARTGQSNAEGADDAESAYSYEQYRSELNGLTYDGVIALADQQGIPISQQYAARRSSGAPAVTGLSGTNQNQTTFGMNGSPVPRPGDAGWPLGANDRGGALYPPQ